MVRLPTNLGDTDAWGPILNEWALVGHNDDGTHAWQKFGGAVSFPTVRSWGLGWAAASTVANKITVLVTGGTSVTLNIQVNGVNILTSAVTVAASASPTVITTINTPAISPGNHVVLVVTAVSGAVSDLEVQLEAA